MLVEKMLVRSSPPPLNRVSFSLTHILFAHRIKNADIRIHNYTHGERNVNIDLCDSLKYSDRA